MKKHWYIVAAVVLSIVVSVFLFPNIIKFVDKKESVVVQEVPPPDPNKTHQEMAEEVFKDPTPKQVEEIPSEKLLNDPEVTKLADCIIKLQPRTTPFVAKYMAMHIIRESAKKKLDPDLVASQIWVESEFNPNATSSKAARGLIQVRYEVWKNTPQLQSNGVDAKHKIYWIDANIQSATDILASFLAEANGNLPVALNRYWTGNPKMEGPPWKNEYVAKILFYYFKIREHKLNGTPLEVEEIEAAPIEVWINKPPQAVAGPKK